MISLASRVKKFASNLITRGRAAHRDQRGLEALQVVMILAVAAVCLLAIKHWWSWWHEYFELAIEIFIEN